MRKASLAVVLLLLSGIVPARGADVVEGGRPGSITAGDLVAVTIYDLVGPGKGATFTVRVDGDGKASLPLVGEVPIVGHTTDQAASKISRAYAEAKFIQNAIVTVGLLESGSTATIKPGPLKTGDRLRITLYELVGPDQPLVVLAMIGENGTIQLPLAGELKLQGLTEAEADKAVAALYRQKHMIQNAIVSVLRLPAATGR